MALKDGFALFDERLGGFLVVGGLAGARMMDRLGVETGLQRQVLGVVDVALDVAQRHRWTLRQRHRQLVRGGLDRKSTRLNSSHQIISYAVFCLKKKKYA